MNMLTILCILFTVTGFQQHIVQSLIIANGASHVNCAWTEGWADFFPLAVNNDPIYRWASGASINLETPTWGTYNWNNGDAVEGRVAGALWDILDTVNDGDDQYSDGGIANIWDTLYHQTDNDFSEYWSAWKARGHNENNAIWSIYQNTIDYRFTLYIQKNGRGSGTVISNPSGINCGPTCSHDFAYNTVVTLMATPTPPSTFGGWTGADCGGTGTCTVTMSEAQFVAATFNLPGNQTLTVSKSGTGSGTVTSNPSGINCGSTCSHDFAYNTVVTLTATAATGSTFTGWSGAGCSGRGTCTVTMTASASVTASFTIGSPPDAFNKSFPTNGAFNQLLNPTLSWGSSNNATSYEYCFDTTNDNACSAWTSNGTSTSKSLNGLVQDTTYYWHVRAVNSIGTTYSDGNSPTAYWSCRTTGMIPSFDKEAPANGATNQPLSLILYWDRTGNFDYYEYCYDTTNDNACSSWTNNGISTSASLSGLNQNTTYYWHVRAVNSIYVTYSDHSSTAFWSFTTSRVPDTFIKTAPTNGATNQPLNLTLSWGNSSNATSYEYCYDATNDNACSAWTSNGTSTSKALTGLSQNTTYYWHVRALNALGITYSDGFSTAFWSFTIGGLPPLFNKTAPANGATNQPLSLTLSWDSIGNATSYEYCYDTTNDNACSSWTNNGTSTSASLSGLNQNTTYYWHVRAVNSFGTTYSNGSSTAFWSFTTGGAPGAFNKYDPVNGTTNQPLSLTLSWASSSNAASYEYCFDTTNDNACSAWTSNGTSTSTPLSGLSQNTTYYWHVRATNAFGATYSDGSSTTFWSFTTGRVPDAFNKTAPANGATNQPVSLTLSWGSSNATSYEYCYDTTNDNACSVWVNNGASTSVPLSGLNANTTYYWHVRATNTVGTTYSNGSSTAFWSFKTSAPPGAFSKTSPPNNALKQPSNPTMKWGTSAGATSYEYCYDTIYNNTCDTSWVNTAFTSAAPGSLNNNTTYYWQVRAVNVGGAIDANAGVWWTFKVVIAPPTLTAPPNGDNLLNNRPAFDWDDVPGATGFTALVGTHSVVASTYTRTMDLPVNMTLYWRVQSRGTNGPSAWSAGRSIKTANPPGVPALILPATNALTTDYTQRLDWGLVTLPLGETFGHYQVQVADNGAFTAPAMDESGLADRLVHEITLGTDLNSNTKYYWRVRSYNTDGEYSAWSLVRYFRTALLPPTLQAPDDGLNLLNNRPAFDWDDVTGATGYTIKISRNSGFTSLVGTYLVTPSTYTPVANLPANLTLYWRVQSRGANGPSAWSAVQTVNTANPPGVPALLLPAINALTTDYTPRLDWGPVTLPVGTTFGHYQVQVADNAAFTEPAVNEFDLIDRLIHEYTPGTDLNLNTKYYWRVRSYNTEGEYSAWSLVRYFRTALSAPVLSTPADGGTTTLLRPPFDWADVSGAASYTIQVSRNGSFTSLVVNATVALSTYTPLVNLPTNIPLYWRVKTNGVNGPSSWSEIWDFTITP
jgi:hypothetical protein